jgi:hypothetical protein
VPSVVIAIVLLAASVMTALVALFARAMNDNQDRDPMVAWYRSFGGVMSQRYGREALAIRARLLSALSLAFFAASVAFAVMALFGE